MDSVKSAASDVRVTPPSLTEDADGDAHAGLITRLAGWCSKADQVQDRDPTVWMHRDVVT